MPEKGQKSEPASDRVEVHSFLEISENRYRISTHSSAGWTLFHHVDLMLVALGGRFYDHVFLREPDFEFVQDGTRRDAAFQGYQHR